MCVAVAVVRCVSVCPSRLRGKGHTYVGGKQCWTLTLRDVSCCRFIGGIPQVGRDAQSVQAMEQALLGMFKENDVQSVRVTWTAACSSALLSFACRGTLSFSPGLFGPALGSPVFFVCVDARAHRSV